MNNLQQFIESHYEASIIGQPMHSTEKGNLYITVALGGVKEQGADFPMTAVTRELAEDWFPMFFLRTLPPVPGGTLVWRMLPEAIEENGRWTVWARAVVEVRA